MRLYAPVSNQEDRLIGYLDSGTTIAQREAEADAIRLDMMWRERCRLAELRRQTEDKAR